MSEKWFARLFGALHISVGLVFLWLSAVFVVGGVPQMREGRVQQAVSVFISAAIFALGGAVLVILGIATLRDHRSWLRRAWWFMAVALSALWGPLLTVFLDLRTLLVLGVLTVVCLGAVGLLLRAKGELKAAKDPESAARWKAAGYFVGALAYVVTASVSLMGAAHLLPTQ